MQLEISQNRRISTTTDTGVGGRRPNLRPAKCQPPPAMQACIDGPRLAPPTWPAACASGADRNSTKRKLECRELTQHARNSIDQRTA
eukprot:COSAG02_NODE_8438_length_2570_cov_1.562930_1_plen_87_part_00